MPAIKTAISLDRDLLHRLDRAAEELQLPRSRLLALAAESFLDRLDNRRLLERPDEAYNDEPSAEEVEGRRGLLVIRQGDVCALTSNLRRGEAPGNVLLEREVVGLSRLSVVNVSQMFTVDQDELVEKIGTLPPQRLRQVLDGIELLMGPRDLAE